MPDSLRTPRIAFEVVQVMFLFHTFELKGKKISLMHIMPPFSADFLEKRFFYLRKTHAGRFDLFLAVPLPPRKRVTSSAIHHENEVAKLSFTLGDDPSSNTQQIAALVFEDIQHSNIAIKYVQIDSLPIIELEDADLDSTAHGQKAMNCPYLNMPIHVRNPGEQEVETRPHVIIPLETTQTILQDGRQAYQDVASDGKLSRIELAPLSPEKPERWELSMFIGQYSHTRLGYFQAEVEASGRPGTRKTKVKHKQMIINGQGVGNFPPPISWIFAKIGAYLKKLIRKLK